MKYRQLSKEQFLALHKEFAQFLATQQIDIKEWNQIKKNEPEMVQEELNLFSDVVWEDVLNKTKYLEHFSKQNINLFKCDDDKVFRIVVTANRSEFNFLNNDDYQWFIDNTNDKSVEFLKGSKVYDNERNTELFGLIEKGSIICNGKLYKSIFKLIS